MSSPVDQAVAEARQKVDVAAWMQEDLDPPLNALVAAVEARCIARIQDAPADAMLGRDAKATAIALIRQETL